MKILISLVLFFGFLGSAVAGPLAVMEILPGSNNPNSTISISSAVTPAIVAISSTSFDRFTARRWVGIQIKLRREVTL